MVLDQVANDDALASAGRPADLDRITGANFTMRFGRLAVHLYFAALAGFLRLRAGLEQTGDVEPDVETHPTIVLARDGRARPVASDPRSGLRVRIGPTSAGEQRTASRDPRPAR